MEYKDGKFIDIKEDEFDEMTTFSVYSNKYLGKYNMLLVDDTWLIYNLDKSDTNIKYLYIAAKGNKKYKFIDFSIQKLNENDEVNLSKILKEYKINNYNELSVNQKIEIDIDKDGENEFIYSVSNVNSSYDEDKKFSFTYILDDGKYTYLNTKVFDENQDYMDVYQSYVYFILEFDKKYNIFTVNVGSEDQTVNIFTKQSGKYKEIFSNRE